MYLAVCIFGIVLFALIYTSLINWELQLFSGDELGWCTAPFFLFAFNSLMSSLVTYGTGSYLLHEKPGCYEC